MFKLFVCRVLLIPFGLLAPLCPGPVYVYARILAYHKHIFPSQTHTLTDPGQLLQQVARAAKPLQQLSSLGYCLHDNSRHDVPADELLRCFFYLWENSAILNFLLMTS